MFVRVWAGERDLVSILVSAISYLMYISVVMDCVTIRVLNLLAPELFFFLILAHPVYKM